ncbi:MAG: hypothetical protein ACOVQL_07380, partial [Limnohabitans sp.]
MPDSAHSALPVVAVFTGDPAGIGPELVETLLAGEVWRARARLILIGQRAALWGMRNLAQWLRHLSASQHEYR